MTARGNKKRPGPALEPQFEEMDAVSFNAVSWFVIELYAPSTILQTIQANKQAMISVPHLHAIGAIVKMYPKAALIAIGGAHDNGVNENSILHIKHTCHVEVFDDGGQQTDLLERKIWECVYEWESDPPSQIMAYGATYPVAVPTGGVTSQLSPRDKESFVAPMMLSSALSVKVTTVSQWISEGGDVSIITSGFDALADALIDLISIRMDIASYELSGQDLIDINTARQLEAGYF